MVLETSAGEGRLPRGSPMIGGASGETETREHRRRRREEGYLRVKKRWGQKKGAFFGREGLGRGEEGRVEERRAWGRKGIVGGEMKRESERDWELIGERKLNYTRSWIRGWWRSWLGESFPESPASP